MGVQRDEDFITEFIFVKLYNRSEAFRELIAAKFNTTVNNISNEIEFTGSNNKNEPQYGCPDATIVIVTLEYYKHNKFILPITLQKKSHKKFDFLSLKVIFINTVS